MLTILAGFLLMLIIVLVKKIPYIGGKVWCGLLACGVTILFGFGTIAPHYWVESMAEGLNRFLWIIIFLIFVNIYAECMNRMGVIAAIVRMLRSIFGNSKRALLAATFIGLVFCGALCGSTSACTMIVGVLMAKALYDQLHDAYQVTVTIVVGSSLGSLLPPVSFGFNSAASTMNMDAGEVLSAAYPLVGIVALLVGIYIVLIFGRKNSADVPYTGERENVGDIFRETKWNLIPLALLMILVILKNGFKIDLLDPTVGLLTDWAKDIKILKAIDNNLVLTFFTISLICLLFYKTCRKDAKAIIVTGLKRSVGNGLIMLCAAFMVGAIVISGAMDAVAAWAATLSSTGLIFGGAIAMMLMGMLTGSNGTAITTVVPFLAPALEGIGITPLRIALASSFLASAGQGAPPADTNTFVAVATMVAILELGKDEELDPVKVMFKSWINWVLMFIMGISLLLF